MKYLNLTEGFNPYNAKTQDCLDFESFVFNGGEPHIKIINPPTERNEGDVKEIMITIRLDSMNELGLLLMAKNAIDNLGVFNYSHLIIPYFPGARQDRVMVSGEPLSAKVYANIINDMDFDSVSIFDSHSDVSPALLDNCENVNNHNFVDQVLAHLKYPSNIQLISPDAGANKKVLKLAQYLGIVDIVKCDKVRNVENGALTGFEVYNDNLKGRPCLIVDDICDGGGTFLGLAKELKDKNAGPIYLAVSHGIFSKGLKVLCDTFEHVFATDSVNTSRYTEAVPLNYTEISLTDIQF